MLDNCRAFFIYTYMNEQNIEFNQVSQITKPNVEDFSNIGKDEEGNDIGNCTKCDSKGVLIDNHVCSKVISTEITNVAENKLMYSQEEIKLVLWNTFQENASKIDLISTENNDYMYNVYPEEGTTLEELINIAEELFASDYFDIQFKRDHLQIKFEHQVVYEFKYFRMFRESVSNFISFDDAQIQYIKQRFNQLNVKYHNNTFFKSIMDQVQKNKRLSKKQNEQLQYLLKNGRTMYEAGILTTKN